MKNRKLVRKGLLRLRLARKLRREEKNHSFKVGQPPGTLIYLGKKKTEKFNIQVIDFTNKIIDSRDLPNTSDCKEYIESRHHSWINVYGLNHIKEISEIGNIFGLDALLLEDVLNSHHRPKLEQFDDFLFLNLKMMNLKNHEDHVSIEIEQMSLILGDKWLLSFQEDSDDVFKGIRSRLNSETSNLRKKEIDYLFYRLVDTLVDNYFIVIEHISNEIELLEDDIIEGQNDHIRVQMQLLRKDLIIVRKAVMPLREAIGNLARENNRFVEKSTMRYFHDVYEHIVQLNEYIDTQRDMISSLGDLYLSGVSHKMNQIMKVLTIISTIFIPLTFIAGIYGMNFINMPELNQPHGYGGVLTIMGVIVIMMLIFFRRKDWL